jgi:F-type H+-transporting ATPase subunit b
MTSPNLIDSLPPVQGMAAAVDLDITALISVVLFLLVYLFLKFTLIDPYLKIVEERENRIEGAQRDAEARRHQAQQILLKYEEQMAQARSDAQSMREELRGSAERERDALLVQSRERAQQELATARASLKDELGAAEESIDTEARSIADVLVGRVLGTNA